MAIIEIYKKRVDRKIRTKTRHIKVTKKEEEKDTRHKGCTFASFFTVEKKEIKLPYNIEALTNLLI